MGERGLRTKPGFLERCRAEKNKGSSIQGGFLEPIVPLSLPCGTLLTPGLGACPSTNPPLKYCECLSVWKLRFIIPVNGLVVDNFELDI